MKQKYLPIISGIIASYDMCETPLTCFQIWIVLDERDRFSEVIPILRQIGWHCNGGFSVPFIDEASEEMDITFSGMYIDVEFGKE